MPPAKEQQESWPAGSTVFFHHPKHSWLVGSVTDESGGSHTCKVVDPIRTDAKQGDTVEKVKGDHISPVQMDVLDEIPHDLLNLTVLQDASLLRTLFLRFMSDIIYTNIGAIIVAINPFNFKIPRYMDDQMQKYLSEGHTIQVNVPHSWAQAHNTFYEMVDEQFNQCILISGESGAGKTEATKIVLKYLAQVSCLGAADAQRQKSLAVGAKLTACSPILESFGNAKTVRNDNSSRFGKFMRVKFDSDNRLSGAFTTKYLLEKSRIITAAIGERCYHSFYIVVRGKLKAFLALEDEKRYRSINSGKTLENKEFSSAEDFEEVYNAMNGVGLKEAEIRSVWKIPAGVLSLQNVNMLADGEGSMLDEDTAGYVSHVAKLWDIEQDVLRRELATTTLVLPGNSFTTKPNNVTVALDIRDALCKHSYDGIFGWLVEKCNEMCDCDDAGNWIGLLDIFGFEDFEKNSFEQMCINLTNETLQNHYNDYIFSRDMEECRAEGIDTADIKCPDNMPCLKMISDPKGGIMSLLDEECLLGKATDYTFLDKIASAHGKSEFFFKKKSSRDTFGIHHYAASVTYDIVGWLDKNRDTLKDAIKSMMRKSSDPLVATVLPEPIPADMKKGKALTVGGFFADQVRQLIEVINSTNPHWIRCVKPHPAKKPKMWDGIQTMNQLESSGVLGTVKIRKAGYPVRVPHDKFVRRYRCIAPGDGSEREIIQMAVQNADIDDKKFYQMGSTKVFLKSEAYQKLEKLREAAVLKWVLELQRVSKGYLGRARLFKAYVEKHRARLLKEKKEREEKEKAEREAAEREAREKEESERRAREAEERRIREEKRKAQERLDKAATCLQRHTRGGLCRIRLLRKFIEMERCKFEAITEAASVEDRNAMLVVDALRQKSERQWIAFLNNVDEIANLKSSEKIREQKLRDQKQRIQRRDLVHKESEARADIAAEEDSAFQTLIARCNIIATHKREIETSRAAALDEHAKRQTHRRASPLAKGPTRVTTGGATVAADDDKKKKKTADDARVESAREQMLANYALNRARAFESYFPQQPPPARDSYHARSHAFDGLPSSNPLGTAMAASSSSGSPGAGSPGGGRRVNSAGASRRGGAKPMTPQMSRMLFERSKNEWERQEEYLQYRQQPAAEAPSVRGGRVEMFGGFNANTSSRGGAGGLGESSGMGSSGPDNNNMFAGPFRTNDAAMRSNAQHSTGGGGGGSPGGGGGGATPVPVPGSRAGAGGGDMSMAAASNPAYTAPRFNTPGAGTSAAPTPTPAAGGNLLGAPSAAAIRSQHSPSHHRAERDFRQAADWEAVFKQQMW